MTTELLHPALSARLKSETHQQHMRMHELMERARPFSNRENYVRFVSVQYLFQRDVECLFTQHEVRVAVPDLDSRGRQADAISDLQDLGAAIPDERMATEGVSMPAALGWLYVSEGSTLGAAFLFKEAQSKLGLDAHFGARNLAAYPEGRAQVWRRFVASLDSTSDIAPEKHDAVIAGANDGYNRFGDLLRRHFALD